MTTLRQRIHEAIVAEYPGTLTNQQLAGRLQVNEPSVRRATRELNLSGHIYSYEGGYANIPISWRAFHPVMVEQQSAAV